MEHFLEKLKKAKSHLVFDRKEAIRADLLRHIEAYEFVNASEGGRPVLTRSFAASIFSSRLFIAGLAIVLLASVGGVSFAAQNTLPGDFLYPVKIGVNENVETALAFSSEAEARIAAKLAKKRVDEAVALAAEHKLDQGTQSELDRAFGEHARQARTNIKNLKNEGNLSAAAGAASDFETGLSARVKVLTKLGGNSSTTEQTIHALSVHVARELETATQDREDLEAQLTTPNDSSTQVAAQEKITAAGATIADVALNTNSAQLGASAAAHARIQLANASATLTEAQVQFSAGAYGNAFKLASAALRIAGQTKALIQADVKLHLGIEDFDHVNGGTDTELVATSSQAGGTTIDGSLNLQGGIGGGKYIVPPNESSDGGDSEFKSEGGTRENNDD